MERHSAALLQRPMEHNPENKEMNAIKPTQRLVRLRIVPTSLEEANTYVTEHHRHHEPVTGHKYSIALADEAGTVRGVSIVGRPVSRMSDNGWTLEVNRCCTDGVRNGCSMLYRAAWQAAKAMGYTKLITYTLPEEGGGSLKGAGFRLLGERGGGKWTRVSRPRVDTHPTQAKWLWELHDFKQSGWKCDFCGHDNKQVNFFCARCTDPR